MKGLIDNYDGTNCTVFFNISRDTLGEVDENVRFRKTYIVYR